MKNPSNDEDVGLLGCLGVVVGLPALTVLQGYVLSTLWGWFVVPAFDLKPLSIALAAGLLAIPHYIKFSPFTETNGKSFFDALGIHVAAAALTLIEGYILHRWFV